MYLNSDRRTFGFGEYTVYLNAAHVELRCRKTGKVLFSRTDVHAANWYDNMHQQIVKAVDALEKVLMDAVS